MATPQDRLLPSASAYAIATVILVFVGGYFIGQGVSLGVFRRSSPGASKESWPNSYDVKVHADSSDEQGGGSSSSSSSSDDDDEVEDEEGEEEGARGERESFDGNDEECKLVLVVRTDLGMGKGQSSLPCLPPPPLRHPPLTPPNRQDRSTMLARDTSMLQRRVNTHGHVVHPPPLGAHGPGQGGAAGGERGGAGDAAGAGAGDGTVCAGRARCGSDAGGEWERDGVGGWAGAAECG